jgi:hypothetical protein
VLVSAEIRWFWEFSVPDQLQRWFHDQEAHPYSAGGGPRSQRSDKYLREAGQGEVGIKARGGTEAGIEIKGLVSSGVGQLSAGPFQGPIEIWTKWSVRNLDLESRSLIVTEKVRWIRTFDVTERAVKEIQLNESGEPVNRGLLPKNGCNVELTRVRLSERAETWWTLGFESFGTIRTVESNLRLVADELSNRRPPKVAMGILASYPVWLNCGGRF